VSLNGAETPHGALGSAKNNAKNRSALENAANEDRNCRSTQFFRSLLERSREPVSRECYDKLGKQCVAEVQAFEEYLNRKEEIFAYLKVESRKP
jgi:hypothetical protein